MRILVIGSGGREHAIVRQLVEHKHTVYAVPGNPGIHALCERLSPDQESIPISDVEGLSTLASDLKVDLTVVGPEQPLSLGIVDHFESKQLRIFGPTKEAAQLESSKVFSKQFMKKYKIPTATFYVGNHEEEARSAAEDILALPGSLGVVVKPDGLTAGKGVTVCKDIHEAYEAIRAMLGEGAYGESGRRVIVEQRLDGQELSVLAFGDGKTFIPMLPSQDHKQLGEGDQGMNTGGMGAYAPTPFVSADLMEKIQKEMIERTLLGLQSEGIVYKGVLYFGVMLSSQGPKLLEYNCRFGDPEAQVILPLLESDLAEIMLACIEGSLEKTLPQWSQKSACCVVLASMGYPKSYPTGKPIHGLQDLEKKTEAFAYHAGTGLGEDKSIVTKGGRVLGITALGETLEESIGKAYDGVEALDFEGVYYRSDIGKKGCIS
ncbi:MAG: phosphoribosylamine--glycine ligase [Waddliaceae bacterium]|nr:phosphoribosylamine--glycine ligase [Waddliaceae bacterium]